MVTQQGANKWMTSCPSGNKSEGADEVRRRGVSMGGEVRKPCGLRTAQQNIHPPPVKRQQVPDAVSSAHRT